MKVITVASVKGGVGKTTTVAMLGHAAAERGIRTLLIDADVQASLTVSFFNDIDAIEERDTAYKLMTGEGDIEPIQVKDNLFVLPADPHLSRLSESRDLSVFTCLKERIGELFVDRYDLIVIDTPGSTSSVLAMSLAAANHVYSPIELAKYSLRAFAEVQGMIGTVRKSLNPGLKFEGFVPNRVRGIRQGSDGPEPSIVKQREIFNELKATGPNMILGLFGLREAIGDVEEGASVTEARGRGSQVAQREASDFANALLERAGFVEAGVQEVMA